MLPIAEGVEGAADVSVGSRLRRTRDRMVTAEVRAIRRRRGWTVVGSETRSVTQYCARLKDGVDISNSFRRDGLLEKTVGTKD